MEVCAKDTRNECWVFFLDGQDKMGRTFAEEGRCRQEAKRKTRVKIDECRGRHAEGWCDRMRRQQFVFKIQSQSINQILISESNKNFK